MTCAGLLALGLAASSVIAAQEGIDHLEPAAEAVADGSAEGNLLLVVMPWIMLAVSGVFGLLFVRMRWHKLAAVPRRPRAVTPEVGLTLFFGMLLVGRLVMFGAKNLLGVEEIGEGLKDRAILQIAYYLGQGLILLVFIGLVRHAKRLEVENRLSPTHGILFGIGALVMVWPMVQTAGTGAGWLMHAMWGFEPSTMSHELLVVFVESEKDIWFWVLAACATIMPGVFEEVMYRGLLQETFRRLRMGAWTSITLTSLVFIIMHYGAVEPNAMAALFVLSLGFGWAYEKSGRLAAPITMHILFNAGNLGMALLTQ